MEDFYRIKEVFDVGEIAAGKNELAVAELVHNSFISNMGCKGKRKRSSENIRSIMLEAIRQESLDYTISSLPS